MTLSKCGVREWLHIETYRALRNYCPPCGSTLPPNHPTILPRGFLQSYVHFMTTPGSHNDTYAESFHRDFFSNYAKVIVSRIPSL